MGRDLRHSWHLNKYTWMSLAFALGYLPVAQAHGLFDVPIWAVWALLGLGVADGAGRTVLALRHGGALTGRWATFFNGLDILLVTAAVAATGGIRSDLWLLYFVILIFESLFASPRSQRLLELYVCLSYLCSTLPRQTLLAHHDPTAVFLRLLISRLLCLVLVSSLARRISGDAQERDRELMLLREQMATGEERARIAREIHDSLGHALVSAILRLELCARLISREPAEAEALLKEEIPAIRAAWNEGRDLAFHLRPWEAEIGETPLPDVLRRHIGRFAERTGLTVNLKVEGDAWELRPATILGLTRIVQEALTNTARHAAASSVEIMLSHRPDRLILCTISDNGAGFEVETAHAGVGLQTMRERAEHLGGTLRIESAPGKGATLTVTLPA